MYWAINISSRYTRHACTAHVRVSIRHIRHTSAQTVLAYEGQRDLSASYGGSHSFYVIGVEPNRKIKTELLFLISLSVPTLCSFPLILTGLHWKNITMSDPSSAVAGSVLCR